MRFLSLLLFLAVSLATAAACTSYSGVTRDGDHLYVAGHTSYFIFGKPFVLRCVESRFNSRNLDCEDVNISVLEGGIPSPSTGQSRPSAVSTREQQGDDASNELPGRSSRAGSDNSSSRDDVAVSSADSASEADSPDDATPAELEESGALAANRLIAVSGQIQKMRDNTRMHAKAKKMRALAYFWASFSMRA